MDEMRENNPEDRMSPNISPIQSETILEPPSIPSSTPRVFYLSTPRKEKASATSSEVDKEKFAREFESYVAKVAESERALREERMRKWKYYRNLVIAGFIWLMIMFFGLSWILHR